MRDTAHMPLYARLGLRARVALTFAGLGFVVSVCVALVALHFSDTYVDRLVDQMLRVEGDNLRDRFMLDQHTPLPHLHRVDLFSNAPGYPPPPVAWTALAAGQHALLDARGKTHLAIYSVGAYRLYVSLDVGEERVRERHLARDLVLLVLFGTILSAWLGWLWAGRAIEPVRRLAQQVEVLEPPRHGAHRLAPGFAADEVGKLAQAFDRYQEKLYEYVRRERAFTADASHEMRTPLAVIRGALEVMLDSNPAAADEARLLRMQRGSDEMRDLLDALLVLARSEEDAAFSGNTPDLNALVANLLRDRADGLRERNLQVKHSGLAGIAIAAPPRVLDVVIGNLMRAASQFADGGEFVVEVAPEHVRIAWQAAQVQALTPVPRSRNSEDRADRVLGLGMIRRVCERWGWKLEERGSAGSSLEFALHFHAAPDSAVDFG